MDYWEQELDRICDEAEKWEDRDCLSDDEVARIMELENQEEAA